MSTKIEIPAHERGVIRVFSLSMADAEAEALRNDPTALNAALGADINATFVEVFPISDLDDIGLLGYLSVGNAVPAEQLAPDRSKLDKLSGWVLIVFSQAFGDQTATLTPVPALTLIGTYGEARVDWHATEKLTAESAKPFSAPPEAVKKKPSDAAMSGRIATLALIVMFALTGLVIWIAG